MKLFTTTLFSALLSLGALAQTTTSITPSTNDAVPLIAVTKDMTEAEVRKIDKDAKKITLKHGPIKNLDMPGMTMVFQIRDTALLDKIATGDKIMFAVEQQQGAFVVTSIEKVSTK